MENEHAEIVAALAACDVMSEFNALLINSWNNKRLKGKALGDVGERHIYRLLYQYRESVPEVYSKYENHPAVVKEREQFVEV
ncbi:hypothetical protein ACN9ML_18475 [Dyadobacter endophyticus]|uniref:hypothetical protein n=1 Tax=Dyadobacter endophyticus TaxID=1749036 RepID=UPI003CEB2CC4